MGRISLGVRVSTWQCMLYNTSPCKRAARTHTTTPALPLPSFSLLVGGWSDYNIDTLSSRGPGFETSIWQSSYDSWLMLVFCESCASLESNFLPPYLFIPAKHSFDRSKNALVSMLLHDWDRAIASPILCKKYLDSRLATAFIGVQTYHSLMYLWGSACTCHTHNGGC